VVYEGKGMLNNQYKDELTKGDMGKKQATEPIIETDDEEQVLAQPWNVNNIMQMITERYTVCCR